MPGSWYQRPRRRRGQLLNKKNAADQRVYELLAETFKLFSGVFGASDDVLGTIESGVDFEKRIVGIYQQCRNEGQIAFEFDQLQKEMEQQIDERMKITRQKLLEHFDEEVHEKLRVNLRDSREVLSKYDSWLWELTRIYLTRYAEFDDHGHSFTLKSNPFPDASIHPGPYRSGRDVQDANLYRLGHPLAQLVIAECKRVTLPAKELTFRYSGTGRNISVLDSLVGRSGVLRLVSLSVAALEREDHLLFAAFADDGSPLDPDQCRRLFSLSVDEAEHECAIANEAKEVLDQQLEGQQRQVLESLMRRNGFGAA